MEFCNLQNSILYLNHPVGIPQLAHSEISFRNSFSGRFLFYVRFVVPKCGYDGTIKEKEETQMMIFLGLWAILCILAL